MAVKGIQVLTGTDFEEVLHFETDTDMVLSTDGTQTLTELLTTTGGTGSNGSFEYNFVWGGF
jgi:hypothetical protein